MEKSTGNAQLAVTPPLANLAAAGGTGTSLFVINLCASIAPARLDGNNIPGLENYRLYQVARVEDGRTRHRLRLGFFTNEKHAESVLAVVRQQYPTAFTACLCEEDRRFARGYLPESAAPAPRPVAVPTPVPAQPTPAAQAAPVAAARPVAQAQPLAPAKAPVAAKPAAATAVTTKQTPAATPTKQTPPAAKTVAAAEPEIVELTWEPETSAAKAPAQKAAAVAPVTKQAAAPVAGLEDFSWEPPSLTPAANAALAKTESTGIFKAAAPKSLEKNTSDTARHPALKLAAMPAVPATPAAVAKPATVAAKATAPVAAKAATPAAKPAEKPAAAVSKLDTSSSMRVRTIELSMSDPPPAPVEAKRTAPAEPFHVGKGVEFTEIDFSLEAEPAKPAAPTQATAAQAKPNIDKAPVAAKPVMTPASKVPAKAAAKPAPTLSTPVASAKAAPTPAAPIAAAKPALPPLPPGIRVTGAPNATPPELDSTQTIRALTSAEMEDAAQEKWFAVQLAVSDQPVNLDAMPRLDIFEAYRLYSVATAGSGKIVHSLRLGFFKEAVSAEAVMGYLNTFFGSPTVMRVSVAEHGRFKDPPVKKPTAAPAHEAKVVELNNARAARPVVPTVTMEVAHNDTATTGTFNTPLNTGSFKASATGKHKTLKSTAKPAGPAKPAVRAKTGNTGKHKALPSVEKRSLAEQLLDEAREVELSESGIRKLPKNDSLISRMFGKLTK